MTYSRPLEKVERPSIEWIPVDEELPPRGTKLQLLTKEGIFMVSAITSDLIQLPDPFIICWQHLPEKPSNWKTLLERLK